MDLKNTAKKTMYCFPTPKKSLQRKELDGKVFFTDWMPTCLHRGWSLIVISDCFVVICTITVILPGPSLPWLLSVSFWTSLSLLAQHMPMNHLQIFVFPPCFLPHPHFILARNEGLTDLLPRIIWRCKPNMIAAVGWDFQMRQSNLHVQLPLKLSV